MISILPLRLLQKQYLENYAELQLAPKTIARYISLFRRIIITIIHIKLEKLQIGQLADLYSQLGEYKNQQGCKCRGELIICILSRLDREVLIFKLDFDTVMLRINVDAVLNLNESSVWILCNS